MYLIVPIPIAFGGIPIETTSICYKNQVDFEYGVCRACISAESPCDVGGLPCCETITNPSFGFACRKLGTTRILPEINMKCGPPPCNDKLMKEYSMWRPKCYDGPVQYYGVNFCKCPTDESGKGFHCVKSKDGCSRDCVPCGLQNYKCSKDSDCCYQHKCKSNKCKQNTCRLEGQDCRNKECADDPPGEECDEPDQKCCDGYRCYPWTKTCSSLKCQEKGVVCDVERADCCEGLKCDGPKNAEGEVMGGTAKCQ